MNYSDIIICFWQDLYNPERKPQQVFDKYLHPDYSQCINLVTLDRDTYLEHVINQRDSMTITHIHYQHIVENGSDVFTLYYPEGLNHEHQAIKAEVIAHFSFKEQLLHRVHGQVQFMNGSAADADMKE